jgi:hypothetical protein
MKVIFLDIDGVLNCDKTPNPRKFPYIVDKKLLVRLKKLLDRTGAKVVLSSTWRCDPVGLFAAKHWGVPFIDVCPDKPRSPRCRGALRQLGSLWQGAGGSGEGPGIREAVGTYSYYCPTDGSQHLSRRRSLTTPCWLPAAPMSGLREAARDRSPHVVWPKN